MPSFFDKPFEEQVEEIIKTGDSKLLQAFIGTRSLIGLSLYCSSFFLTRTVIVQAKYQACSALLNVLTEYQKPEKEIFVDNIKRDIERQISGNEDRLRQKALLPSSNNNLKSLTNSSCSDLESYVQETDVSSLCTFNLQKVIEIYHNYISREEVKELERVLLTAKEEEDKYSYIERQKTKLNYHSKRTEAFNVEKDTKPLLLKIKDKSFFDSWYEELLRAVLDEVKENKKHILHGEIVESSSYYSEGKTASARSELGTAFNKKAMRRVINKLVEDYLKVLPDSLGVKESLLSEMKCVDISDYRGRMNHEAVNHRIISRANEVILSKSIVQKNLSDDVERGLQYIVENMDVSLLEEVEQEMLNEIAARAASHREKDNKKKDLELLAICNGGEFQDKLSLPTDLSFSEIERLYKDMLLIKFTEQQREESLYGKLPLLGLEEIKEAFPASITDDILKSIEESLGKYVKTAEDLKKEIVNNVFGKKENIEKLYELEKELEFSFMQRLFYPIYYGQYQEIKSFVECKSFIHDNIKSEKDVRSREELKEEIGKLEKTKREESKRLLLSLIDNEFQGLADLLISRKDELRKKGKEEFRLSKILHPSYWESYIKREKDSLKICEEALRKSVATGDDELFYKAIEDIKKDSKYMWVFQVNKALFEGVYKTQHDSRKKTLSFRELAEKFIGNRKKYIAEQQDECKIRKATAEQQQVNSELTEKDMNNQKELHAMAEKNEISERRVEEAEAKVEMERAEKKALNLLYDEVDDQDISRKRIKQNKEVQKFLECQYTFLILNEGYTTKFKNLCKEYRELKKALADEDYMYIDDFLEKASKEDFLSIFRERNEETLLEIAIRRPYVLATISNDAQRKGALEEFVEGILYYSKQEGYKSKLEAFWKIECEDADCYAIKSIKAILVNKDRAQEMLDEIHQIEKSVLFERLQKAIENKNCITSFLKGSSKGDFLSVVKDNELLNKAISCGHYEAIRDILSMAKKYGILKEFEKDINDLADPCLNHSGGLFCANSLQSFLNCSTVTCTPICCSKPCLNKSKKQFPSAIACPT